MVGGFLAETEEVDASEGVSFDGGWDVVLVCPFKDKYEVRFDGWDGTFNQGYEEINQVRINSCTFVLFGCEYGVT